MEDSRFVANDYHGPPKADTHRHSHSGDQVSNDSFFGSRNGRTFRLGLAMLWDMR